LQVTGELLTCEEAGLSAGPPIAATTKGQHVSHPSALSMIGMAARSRMKDDAKRADLIAYLATLK
jgi:hypothetical protein